LFVTGSDFGGGSFSSVLSNDGGDDELVDDFAWEKAIVYEETECRDSMPSSLIPPLHNDAIIVDPSTA